jgi:hypothetical protein
MSKVFRRVFVSAKDRLFQLKRRMGGMRVRIYFFDQMTLRTTHAINLGIFGTDLIDEPVCLMSILQHVGGMATKAHCFIFFIRGG